MRAYSTELHERVVTVVDIGDPGAGGGNLRGVGAHLLASGAATATYGHQLDPVRPAWAHLNRSLPSLCEQTFAELTALAESLG
jgi:hypothetical protein